MRFANELAGAFLAGICASFLPAGAAADEPPPLSSPREVLEPVGIDASFFAAFADDRPRSALEREKLLALIYRMRRMNPRTLEKFSKPARDIRAIGENPAEFRGEVFSVPGRVRYCAREELPPELREKFQFDALYRCEMNTILGNSVTLYTSAIPAAWRLDRPIDRYGRGRAMFIKILAPPATGDAAGEEASDDPGGRRRSLLFVAPRVAWYPNSLLGRLRMDAGLFDDVRDRTPLEERECFYQLLAAVRRASDGEIERAGRDALEERRNFLERLARNRELGPKARVEAQRALERAEQGADGVAPLFNQPAEQRGKLMVLAGDALRAVEVRVDDPDIRERFDIDHYYEVEIVTPDSQNNPIVCCVAQLPPEMPLGESIRQHVRVTGFFLKSWAFDSRKSSADGATPQQASRKQLAPLLVAKTVHFVEPPQFGAPNMTLVAGLLVAVFVFAFFMWQVRRGDRRALAAAEGEGERVALDDLDIASEDGPRGAP